MNDKEKRNGPSKEVSFQFVLENGDEENCVPF